MFLQNNTSLGILTDTRRGELALYAQYCCAVYHARATQQLPMQQKQLFLQLLSLCHRQRPAAHNLGLGAVYRRRPGIRCVHVLVDNSNSLSFTAPNSTVLHQLYYSLQYCGLDMNGTVVLEPACRSYRGQLGGRMEETSHHQARVKQVMFVQAAEQKLQISTHEGRRACSLPTRTKSVTSYSGYRELHL